MIEASTDLLAVQIRLHLQGQRSIHPLFLREDQALAGTKLIEASNGKSSISMMTEADANTWLRAVEQT